MLKETNGEIDLKETETQSPPPTTTNTKTSTNNTTTQAEIDESLQVHQQQPVSTLPTTPIVIEKSITTTKNNKENIAETVEVPPSFTTTITPQQTIKMATPNTSTAAGSKPFNRMQAAKVRLIPDGRKQQLNTRYLVTLPGVLKLAELLVGFVAFILAICADRRSTASAWTAHITFETTIVVCILILLYVVFPHLSLSDERNREGLVVVELIFYGLNTLLFFIAIWLMIHLAWGSLSDSRGAAIMGAIFCFALCVIYAVETFIKYMQWVGQDIFPQPADSPYVHRVPPAPAQEMEKRYEPKNGNEEHVAV
uniref:MARVEL domain-containing protein n=1 Tax=Meloidogyne enterolobii TaxID=390850 RepID=A0A6V7X7N2_MELEN|nr:unnamed protein product [Meloidogyne enterolobii]